MEIILCLDDLIGAKRNQKEISIDNIELEDFREHVHQCIPYAQKVTFNIFGYTKVLKDKVDGLKNRVQVILT